MAVLLTPRASSQVSSVATSFVGVAAPPGRIAMTSAAATLLSEGGEGPL